MVKVGFIVEGDTEQIVVGSKPFKNWLFDECQLELVEPIMNVSSKDNLRADKIGIQIEQLKIQVNPDKIVVLADLDPDQSIRCITERKQFIGSHADLVLVASYAIEAWFLADTQAMRKWTGKEDYYTEFPEKQQQPWEIIRSMRDQQNRGSGRIISFTRKFIKYHGFSITKAAEHPNCHSARYCVDKLQMLRNA